MAYETSPAPCRSPVGRRVALLAAVLALGACATHPRPGAGDPPAAPVPQPATAPPPAPEAVAPVAPPGPASALHTESQWLQSWFDGTPVVISQSGDGPLAVSVPLAFCFDTGARTVKPPLAAVLDKVAESLRRHPRARLVLVAAPGDGAGASPLALQRATQVRAQLRLRGVRELQLGSPTAATAAAVQLRMVLAPLP
jgi:outer membrane protein OmpA-like peptidoglycan-associated protein